MPSKPICQSCEEKELVRIETDEGHWWACAYFKKCERGIGCGILIPAGEYAERKAELLEAKEAARRREEEQKILNPTLPPEPKIAPDKKAPAEKRPVAAAKTQAMAATQCANPACSEAEGQSSAPAHSSTHNILVPADTPAALSSSTSIPAAATRSALTQEQKDRIERNRQIALARRAQALAAEQTTLDAACYDARSEQSAEPGESCCLDVNKGYRPGAAAGGQAQADANGNVQTGESDAGTKAEANPKKRKVRNSFDPSMVGPA
jgi:hypothetical protein